MGFNPMSIVASAVSGGLDVASALGGHALAMRRQKQAQGYQSDMFQRRYQMTVADLKAAGLNPMLAVQQGGGSPPGSSAASSGKNMDLGRLNNETKLASAQAALLKAQTDRTYKEADIKGPQAMLMRAIEKIFSGVANSSAKSGRSMIDKVGDIVKGGFLSKPQKNKGRRKLKPGELQRR